jgi:predicted nucleic acid-binding Zn ribbon protein
MPYYDFTCSVCGSTIELNKKIVERDETTNDMCTKCCNVGTLERSVSSALVGYSTTTSASSYGKIPSGFKDVLNRIHERSPGSKLDKTSTFL